MLSKKHISVILVVFGVAVIIYSNRGTLHPMKAPLDADNGSADAITRALDKLKVGAVDVKSTPEEVKQAV
jgi:hypothetical protein